LPDELDAWMTKARDEGDRDAFARLVESCHHLLRASLLRDTADPELADELAQETLVRAWDKRHQYRPGTSPRSWLLTIARSQLMEYHRREERSRRHLKQLVREELLRKSDARDRDDDRAGRLAAIRECLSGFDPRHRELLDLVHAKGLTTEGAAEILGIRPPACRQRLSRIQRALRKCAEKKLALAR
jgi:RNA polymerase sigma-70 factor (ECF subfamily)